MRSKNEKWRVLWRVTTKQPKWNCLAISSNKSLQISLGSFLGCTVKREKSSSLLLKFPIILREVSVFSNVCTFSDSLGDYKQYCPTDYTNYTCYYFNQLNQSIADNRQRTLLQPTNLGKALIKNGYFLLKQLGTRNVGSDDNAKSSAQKYKSMLFSIIVNTISWIRYHGAYLTNISKHLRTKQHFFYNKWF